MSPMASMIGPGTSIPGGIIISIPSCIMAPISPPLASAGAICMAGPTAAPTISPMASNISGDIPKSSMIGPIISPMVAKASAGLAPSAIAVVIASIPVPMASAKPSGLALTMSITSAGICGIGIGNIVIVFNS